MPSQDSSSRDYDLLDRLVEEFNDRFRKGERPSLGEYCQRYPHLADDLRELLPAIAQVEQAKDGLAQEVEAAETPAPALQHLGDFRILREVGHGGMGVVYEAEQVSLGRRVALKVLTERLMRDDKHKRRFEREARAAARLHHTNIVPVFGTGEAAGVPYYVMQFIQGMGLDAVVEELARLSPGSGSLAHAPASPAAVRSMSAQRVARSLLTGDFPGAKAPEEKEEHTQAHAALLPASPGPILAVPIASDSGRLSDSSGAASSVTLPGQNPSADGKRRRLSYFQSVAQIGMQVADALDHAHKQGVVHRDVKPSNLLLDLNGTVWVTDFGLAKAEGAENLTHTGDILGTLRYMPPEAFDGKADARGDVYSLGLTLYELVALRPAFDQRERNQLVKQVTTAEVQPLGTRRRGVPRDLETIVHKAIDRDPARRYQTVGELRDDLVRFVDDEPIRARRQTLPERYVRWARHHPAIAVLGAVLTAVLVLATAASLIVAGQMSALARSEAQSAEEERKARQEAEEGKAREATLRQQAERGKAREANLRAQEAKLRAQAEVNFAKAQAAVDDYFTRVSENRLLHVPGLKDLRKELLLSALKFYQDFLKDRADDPTVRTGLAGAYLRVGKIRADLGEQIEARAAYEQALRLYGELLRANPTDVETQHGLASCHSGLGRHAEAAALWEKLVKPDQPRFQRDLAQTYNALALTYSNANVRDRELAYRRKALAVCERLLAMDPNDPGYRGDLAQTLNNMAVVLEQQGGTAAALALFRRAAANFEEGHRLRLADTLLARYLAISQRNVSRLESRVGNTEAAVAALRRVVEVRRWVVRDNPTVPAFRNEYINDAALLAELLLRHNGRADALRAIRETREVLENVRDDSPFHLIILARARVLHADVLKNGSADLSPAEQAEHRQAMDDAAAAVKRAVATDGRYALGISASPQFKTLLERADLKNLVARAAALALARDPVTAAGQKLAAAERILKEKEKLALADPSNRRVRADRAAASQAVGLLQLNMNQLDEARLSLEKALALWQQLAGEQPRDVQGRTGLGAVQIALGDLHWKADRLAEWRQLSRQGVASLQEADRLAPSAAVEKQLDDAHLSLADRYAELSLWAESAAELRLALKRVGYDAPHQGEGLFCDAGHLFLLAGDQDGYCKCAAEGLRLQANTENTVEAQQLLLLLALSPDAPADAKQRGKLAGVATRNGDVYPNRFWVNLVQGASDYRAGKAAEAVDSLSGNLVTQGPFVFVRISTESFRALALHRLGRLDEAKAVLNVPAQLLDNETRAAATLGRLHDQQWSSQFIQNRQSGKRRTVAPQTVQPSVQQSICVWSSCLNAYREAAKVVLGRTDPHGPYLRLLRGRSYARLGEKALAQAEFAAALAARPNDPDVLALRARIYTALDQRDLAAADVAKCKELTDRLLAGPIEDPETAGRLADYLLAEADGLGTVVKPTRVKSEGGATLTVQPDGSMLASGLNPAKDVYTVEAEVEPGSFTHLRLEVLPHLSLPRNGPGRAGNGYCALSEISLQAAPADGKRPAASVPFVRAESADAGNRFAPAFGAAAAIDGKAETFWNIWNAGLAPTAWFELAKPVGGSGRTRLTIRLEFQGPSFQASLGRFRLSLLKAPPVRLAIAGRLGAATVPGWSGVIIFDTLGEHARLSLVLSATGRHPAAAARAFIQAMDAEKWPVRVWAVREVVVQDAAVFAELIKLRPRDADLWTARSRHLIETGKQKEAKELTDKLLAGPVENAEAAGLLADTLLALADGPTTVVKPTRVRSEGGATLTVQPDGSVLASGFNPAKDVYTLEAEVGSGSFTALRLEALPHPSLARNGPGRSSLGDFRLSEISLQAAPADTKGPLASVPFVRASATTASAVSAVMDAAAAIDGKAETYWPFGPGAGQGHTAWFELAKPVGGSGRTRLTIRLEFQTRYRQTGLGRFRLSLLTVFPARLAAAGRSVVTSRNFLGGYARLAAVLAAAGRHATAARVFVQTLEAEKTPAKLLTVRQAAVSDATVFAEAVKLRPKDAELWIARGAYLRSALADKKDLEGAIAAFKQAIRLAPKLAVAHTNLGFALLDKKDGEGAIAAFKEAVRVEPGIAVWPYFLGNVLRDSGRLDEAERAYREAVRLDGDRHGVAIDALALLLRSRGDLEGAIVIHRKAIQLTPGLAYGHNNLADTLTEKGDLEGAVAEYQEAIRLDPRNAYALARLPQVQRMRELLPRLADVLAGKDKPKGPAEACEFAQLCARPFQKRYAAAVSLYENAFAAEAKLADDLTASHRYNAACYAARAARGDGIAAPAGAAERLALRGKALAWLRADLALQQKQAASAQAALRQTAAAKLLHWQADPELSGVRPGPGRGPMPAEELSAWDKLWDDVKAAIALAHKPRTATPNK